ncbi:MAG: YdjY domain-containing protein [Limisphaerales bacterium]
MQRRIPWAAAFERFALVAAGVGLLCLRAPGVEEKTAAPSPALSTQSTNAPVKEIAPGIFQVGAVRLDQKHKSVTFPATRNLNDGLIEYLLVTSTGKVHESLLRTDIEPSHLQVAMLLLGARGAPGPPLTSAPPGGPVLGSTLAAAAAKPMGGAPVRIEVEWQLGPRHKRVRIEQLVLDRKAQSPMTEGDFIFNGSRIWNGTFIAQRDGSIISTVTDPDALFNNPRPGRDDDQNWQIIPTELPPIGTPMQVTITLRSTAYPPNKNENH